MGIYRKTIKDINVAGRKVMVRAGLDVPLDQTKDLLDPNRVIDDTRIRDVLLTLKYLVEKNAKIILAAGWCGRPKGEDPDYSMAPVAKRIEILLKDYLKKNVLIAPNCFIDKKPRSVNKNRSEVKKIVSTLEDGQIVVLENVRYDPEANSNDEDFASFLASLAEVYVNDNETQNHRPEASIVATPVMIAEKGGEVVYGLKYVDVLDKIGGLKQELENPDRGPFVFGLCGKKIESDPGITSKITVGMDLISTMRAGDTIITGGAVTYTFLLAQHYANKINDNIVEVNSIVNNYNNKIVDGVKGAADKKEAAKITSELQKQKSDKLKELIGITDADIKALIGNSYIRWGQEGEQIVFAANFLNKAKEKNIDIITAFDHIIANSLPDQRGILPDNAEIRIFDHEIGIPSGFLGVAEGPATLEKISYAIKNAAVYLQSGPYSIEDERTEQFSKTDSIIFNAVLECKTKGGVTIGAGGDTTARINARNVNNNFSIVTSAGGATLELIKDGTSKGQEAVEEAVRKSKP
ncbi:MAG: phosphoglycerate kinase [Nanoarchaeota archaeon]